MDVSGPADAEVATSLQATVYDTGVAAGSLAGGLALDRLGAAALPWTAPPLMSVALVVVALGRRHAFPGRRYGTGPDRPSGQPSSSVVTPKTRCRA
ncbi:hypothetical protein AB0N16_31615 [Streptomyces sp. NPDC051105]|uniref:hypothetical protein n=1 Tax=Streptomyces sp. NPDC051105 TaxID=3154843 RepID=UPI003424597B